MYKFYKKTILYLVLSALLIILGSAVAFAETPPHEEVYSRCNIYVNNVKISDRAYTVKGNIYITIDTLKKYGQTDFMTFDTAHNKIYFNASDINISLGSSATSKFIKQNAGRLYIPIKYFDGENGVNKKNHVSLGSVSQLCKIAYRYEGGSVYLYPYKDAARLWVSKSHLDKFSF